MNRLFRGLALAIALLAGSAFTQTALAEEAASGVMKVDDAAGLFSTSGIAKAKENFESTTFKAKTYYLVVTADQVPSSKKSEWEAIVQARDANARDRFAGEWARTLAKKDGSQPDVVTLVYQAGSTLFSHTISDRETDVHRNFNDKKARELDSIFLTHLRKVKGDKLQGAAAQQEMDAALVSAAEVVISDLKNTSVPEAGSSSTKNNGGQRALANGGGGGIGGWICMIGCVIAGIWLVTALIRMFTGGGGYGGGGYGGPGYGGGGGFMTSLLGGMFGAAAGMWMYNNFFGGSYANDAMAGDSYGNDGGGYTDTGAGDYDGGASGGDGDWGDGGGGDWGGGGGDFGGGDFGGGDW